MGRERSTTQSQWAAKWVVLLLLIQPLASCRSDTSGQEAKDARTTAQVRAALANDVGLATATHVSVKVTEGIVTLSGRVDTAERRTRAEQVARGVPNVVRVVNNLQVGLLTRAPLLVR